MTTKNHKLARTSARFSILILLLALNLAIAHSDDRKIKWQVFLPDGKPAAGARVFLRTFSDAKNLEKEPAKETVFIADEQGRVEVSTENNFKPDDTLLIDAEGCAIAEIRVFRKSSLEMPDKYYETIRLQKDFQFRGRVVDTGGLPVAGAQVTLMGLPINWPQNGISTPQLITSSEADGTFVMRGLSDPDDFRSGPALEFYATSRDGEKLLAFGQKLVDMREHTPATNYETGLLILRPTIQVRGTVVNEFTNQPVDGARVSLQQDLNFYWPPAPVEITKNGHFEFRNVPLFTGHGSPESASPIGVTATHSTLPMVQRHLIYYTNFDEVQPLYDVTLKMRPLTTLSGRMIDVETGKPPLWPPLVNGFRSEREYDFLKSQSGVSGQSKVAPESGSFSMQLSAGTNGIGLSGPGFYILEEVLFGEQNVLKENLIDLPLQGQSNAILKVRKQPGVWIHLDTDDPSTQGGGSTFSLLIRDEVYGSRDQSLRRAWTFLPVKKWGDVVEVRVMSYQKEIISWKKLVADPVHAPIVVSIPTQQKSPILIGPQLPLRFSKYNFD